MKNNSLPGEVAFKLYDTYGFPLDLTADILKNKNIKVDNKGFEKEMEKSKKLARANWKGSGDKSLEEKWFKIREQINPTEFLGYVLVKKNSEIGSCSTIDRGSLSITVIGENTYLDNQVHIAHNVKIGSNCIIAGQVGIAGSATLGNNVMIGGQAGISGHLKIGNNVQIGGGSGVIKNIPDNTKVMGYPATEIRNFLKKNK